MEKALQELLAKTKHALAGEDWSAVELLWQPWADQGDPEAQYQLAYHYFWFTPCGDDATRTRMKALVKEAAAKDHPDAIWFQTRHTDPDYQQQLLRAGHLGSVNAQRALGVNYATGDWSGPKDLSQAVHWYRLAAEQGHAESQYDLGFMLLLGEGEPKNPEQGIACLERSGEQGEYRAFQLLVDCYENGYCDVPLNPHKALEWRSRMEEYERLNPPRPRREYAVEGATNKLDIERLWEIGGVSGFILSEDDNQFVVFYDASLITPAQLDEKIRATGLNARPIDSMPAE